MRMKTAEVASRFLKFFKDHDHVIVPSAPLVYNDPTLLFVNAGMVPFKNYYTGVEKAPWASCASTQKCLRTLDIDEVGKTTRHGTFFQMNGNFAVADYFKKGAIDYAWKLVTTPQSEGGYGFDPDQVWVTVLGPGFHPDYPDGDVEAATLWQEVGVPAERIQRRNLKDNYWSMGVPGPGGPCSEIYIDRGPKYGPDGGPIVDEDRFLEIWNLVFQTEELAAVRAKDDFDIAGPLPSKNIDTGMGVERVALLLQGVDNMYEIDQVYPVIERVEELSGRKYRADHVDDVRMRKIADHVRSGLMIMTEGVTPGNEARNYVLRRLLRRSVYEMQMMGVKQPVLVDLLGVSKDKMKESYPEIAEHWDRTAEVAQAEEETFRRTLNQGRTIFATGVQTTKETGSKVFSGDLAFQLHDTYGFPIDLTLDMAEDEGLSVDREKFVELMAEQKQRAKADARAKKGQAQSVDGYLEVRKAGETPFLGYTELSVPTKVRGILVDGEPVDRAGEGAVAEIVLAETPFYAESGGQDADAGVLKTDFGELEVLDVQKPVPGLIVHKVILSEELHTGAQVLAQVNADYRKGACQAHSATHIIGAALREYVGQDATQAGSYNKPGYLRFDYSAQHGLSVALRQEIEERCNLAIRDDLQVTATEMKLEEAKAMGAMSLFGEKYPPIVRMVQIGGPWSRELCGGTHVASSSQIGLLNLITEGSVGSGARRVEALVSTDAFSQFAAERALVNELTQTLRVQPDQLADRVAKLLSELKAAQKQVAELQQQALLADAAGMVSAAQTVNGIRVIAKELDDIPGEQLRNLAQDLSARLGSDAGVVALIGGPADKPAIVVAVNAAAQARGAKAGDLIKVAAPTLGGRGGGGPQLAQGGGSDRGQATAALKVVTDTLANLG
jgi:alanyl-tRNA synthetase